MTRRTTLIALAAAAWLPASAFTREPTATVLSIGDGDTLRVQDRGRTITVRLACIDAPEMAQSPWGQQARQQLQAMVSVGSGVQLRIKASNKAVAPLLSTATDLALLISSQLSELIGTRRRSSKA